VLAWTSSGSSRLQASVRFLGYSNLPSLGTQAGVVQVSNAGPFAIVRCRSPVVMLDPPAGRQEYAPAGCAVLRPGECGRAWAALEAASCSAADCGRCAMRLWVSASGR
jgi:hypothetical protein